MPRRRGAFWIFGLCPWCAFWSNKIRRAQPEPGHSPGIVRLLSAGHSHRLTSDGKAEPGLALTLEAELLVPISLELKRGPIVR
jgi:hypothetical protein